MLGKNLISLAELAECFWMDCVVSCAAKMERKGLSRDTRGSVINSQRGELQHPKSVCRLRTDIWKTTGLNYCELTIKSRFLSV